MTYEMNNLGRITITKRGLFHLAFTMGACGRGEYLKAGTVLTVRSETETSYFADNGKREGLFWIPKHTAAKLECN